MSREIEKATHVYIGRIKCGCVVAVVIDTMDKETGNDVAEFIASGYAIERMTFEDWKRVKLGCKCSAAAAAGQGEK